MHAMKKNSFQQIRLTEDEYKGHPFLDVRIYVKGEGGKYYPTRQGLAVPLERVDDFADLVEDCRQTLEKKDGPYGNAMLESVEVRSDGKDQVDNER